MEHEKLLAEYQEKLLEIAGYLAILGSYDRPVSYTHLTLPTSDLV